MPDVIYIHGFLSSPSSYKAQATSLFLEERFPDVNFYCPSLSSYPLETLAVLTNMMCSMPDKPFLIGSSLGGFWASHFVEMGLANKAVLVNPAVSPHTRFTHYIGQPLQSYYSDDEYILTPADLQVLEKSESPQAQRLDNYWLLVQKDDEVLNYQEAVTRYHGARQSVLAGGNHSFEDFEQWLPDIMQFFEI